MTVAQCYWRNFPAKRNTTKKSSTSSGFSFFLKISLKSCKHIILKRILSDKRWVTLDERSIFCLQYQRGFDPAFSCLHYTEYNTQNFILLFGRIASEKLLSPTMFYHGIPTSVILPLVSYFFLTIHAEGKFYANFRKPLFLCCEHFGKFVE